MVHLEGQEGESMTHELTPEQRYKDFKTELDFAASTAADNIVRIGCLLIKAQETDVLQGSGYGTVTDFAAAEYGWRPDQVSRFTRIAERYGDQTTMRIKDKFRAYGQEKLVEMLTIPDEIAEHIQPTQTREEIRDIKKDLREEGQLTPIEKILDKPENPGETCTAAAIREWLGKTPEIFREVYSQVTTLEEVSPEELRETMRKQLRGTVSVNVRGYGTVLLDADSAEDAIWMCAVREKRQWSSSWKEILQDVREIMQKGRTVGEAYRSATGRALPESEIEKQARIEKERREERKKAVTAVLTAHMSDEKLRNIAGSARKDSAGAGKDLEKWLQDHGGKIEAGDNELRISQDRPEYCNMNTGEMMKYAWWMVAEMLPGALDKYRKETAKVQPAEQHAEQEGTGVEEVRRQAEDRVLKFISLHCTTADELKGRLEKENGGFAGRLEDDLPIFADIASGKTRIRVTKDGRDLINEVLTPQDIVEKAKAAGLIQDDEIPENVKAMGDREWQKYWGPEKIGVMRRRAAVHIWAEWIRSSKATRAPEVLKALAENDAIRRVVIQNTVSPLEGTDDENTERIIYERDETAKIFYQGHAYETDWAEIKLAARQAYMECTLDEPLESYEAVDFLVGQITQRWKLIRSQTAVIGTQTMIKLMEDGMLTKDEAAELREYCGVIEETLRRTLDVMEKRARKSDETGTGNM